MKPRSRLALAQDARVAADNLKLVSRLMPQMNEALLARGTVSVWTAGEQEVVRLLRDKAEAVAAALLSGSEETLPVVLPFVAKPQLAVVPPPEEGSVAEPVRTRTILQKLREAFR